ncbi:hypothetical protein ACQ4PT_051264 [Festuca glaucescens]
MAAPPKAWRAEYAKSGRSSCKSCKSPIGKDALRLGKMVQATQFDGFMPVRNISLFLPLLSLPRMSLHSIDESNFDTRGMWNHASCILNKKNQIKSVDDVEGIDALRWDDQEKIRNYVESSSSTATSTTAISDKCTIEVAQSARASCRRCSEKITKGTVRVSSKLEGQGWYHVSCFLEMSPTATVEKFPGWETLSQEDTGAILDIIKKGTASKQQTTSKGSKRKNGDNDMQDHKAPKLDGSVSEAAKPNKGKLVVPCDSNASSADLQQKLKVQSDTLWKLKDELKKHVSTAELRDMLEVNEQDPSGPERDLLERCADGMLFGALGPCPVCTSCLYYYGGHYQCNGYVSEWSKCTYTTTQPVRIKKKWKIPDEIKNDYLTKWFKSQKVKKPDRVLPQMTPQKSVGQSTQQFPIGEALDKLRISIVGQSKDVADEWKEKLKLAGAIFNARVTKDINCLVSCGGLDNENPEVRKARRLKIPIVRGDYLGECIRKNRVLPFDLYKVETTLESSKGSTVTVKVKGRSAVHEASGLQDTGHILEDAKSIYNTTLNMSDMTQGVNRQGFCSLFVLKFVTYIDYGVRQAPKQKDISKAKSSLAPQLLELMMMLFNVETYRAAMMEFEINMSEMPLGKLSKENIQKGFEALTEIQNLLDNTGNQELALRESLIIAASNRFFTLIPSVHPHIIRDKDDLTMKVKMLEALQDIEIASRLVGFDGDNDESLDDKYKKLHCDITPLAHDSEDYKLVKKYLLNTHAPTHKDWSLELEEVYVLDRDGESNKYSKYRNNLHNKMLLWHGSRLTNFIGILSQGLRIAPREAPVTGYMFGKGLYFADLVSKSAQYCYVDKNIPTGLMLLSEVALGDMHELKKATPMDKPPRGKHSTKGLGKTVPLESEFVKWRDDVIVPCGKPVPASIRASELLYNEYIVYNTSQVKMQFLLKVRFHHKR